MNKLFRLLAFAAIISLPFACTPEEEAPSAEFKDKILALHATQSVEVTVTLDKPAVEAVSIPVEFTCASNGFNTSAKNFDFATGESSKSMTVTDLNLPAGESITMKLLPVKGVTIGTNFTCVITKDAEETLIYTFSSAATELVSNGTSNVTLSLTGLYSGAKFMAAEDMIIPVVFEGEGKDLIGLEEGVTGFKVVKGGNTATLKLIGKSEIESKSTAVLKLGTFEGAPLSAGEISSVTVSLSVFDINDLLGTWTFSEVYDVDELAFWFEDMEDDPTLLPLNNEGFTLNFSEDKDGNLILTPGTTGDFANFFRTATVTFTSPWSLCASNEITGKYSAKELNMFHAESLGISEGVNNTFFELSQANRAFSSETETLGKSVISLRITEDGDLELSLRDYDTPPFGEMWWDYDEEAGFDPEMFGFLSVFTKAE